MTRPLRIAILGSGKASSSQALINYIRAGKINATIVIMATDVCDAGVLERGKVNNIPTICFPPSKILTNKNRNARRKTYDTKLLELLTPYEPDVIYFAGYMRIVTSVFINAFQNRIFNVHPSLLPRHAGLMDLEVHKSVLKNNDTISGCTIHYVTEEVDGGEIIHQSICPVNDDTPESLKQKIQILEGQAWIETTQLLETIIQRNQECLL